MTTPTPTKSVPVITYSSTTKVSAIPTYVSGGGQVFIPGLSGVCGIVMVVSGLLL